MDFFGIGQAIQGAVQIYFRSARATGRTTVLLDSVKEGDRIITSTREEAHRLEHILRDRKLNVQCLRVDPRYPEKVWEQYGRSEGRTIFDHSFIEEHYLACIEEAGERISGVEKAASGPKVPERLDINAAFEDFRKWLC